ncbi:hypothetical protein EVAR_101017_1 [Eumeta japonica]|uniref:Uncharacterized protein n=1 Tax=Eumeta variegata TaxID=151549 RepID=A0A4C1SAL6_EUMVA|nr:hypothetical protein EVAR_101017_1 [Eumeta japonica]
MERAYDYFCETLYSKLPTLDPSGPLARADDYHHPCEDNFQDLMSVQAYAANGLIRVKLKSIDHIASGEDQTHFYLLARS